MQITKHRLKILGTVIMIILGIGILIDTVLSDTSYCEKADSPDSINYIEFIDEAITCEIIRENDTCRTWNISNSPEAEVMICNQ